LLEAFPFLPHLLSKSAFFRERWGEWAVLAPSRLQSAKIEPKLKITSVEIPVCPVLSLCCSPTKENFMAGDSVYKITEIIGTSTTSWEDAARNAVETASKTLRDLRVAEIVKLDLVVENSKVVAYRARVSLSFKYETGK
jgi:flavin-binding protein dodecin